MKVQFKTQVTTGGAIEPAGTIHSLTEDQARKYIERGLAVEVKRTAEEIKAEAKAEAEAKDRAAAEKAAKAADKAAKAAESEKAGA